MIKSDFLPPSHARNRLKFSAALSPPRPVDRSASLILIGIFDSHSTEEAESARKGKSAVAESKTQPIAYKNSTTGELVINLLDLESVEKAVLAAAGYGANKSAAKAKRSWDMDLWPALLRRCGVVNERMIAPGLRSGENDFPLGCSRWEYEMFAEQLFGPNCLGVLVNRAAGREIVTNRTHPVYPKRVQWRVCHGWCRDPRLSHPTCLAAPIDRNPMYD